MLTTTLALALAITPMAVTANPQSQEQTTQQQQPTQPAMSPQLTEMSWILGTWEGHGKATGLDKKLKDIDGSANVSMVLDNWIQWDSSDIAPGEAPMAGRFMLGYNSMSSQWEGYWYDNLSPFATKFTGQWANNMLTLNSEAVQHEPGKTSTYTVVFTKKTDNEMTFKLSTNMDGTNAVMVDYVYTKR